MPGQTAHGFPYAVPEDKRINWPATSQQLAEKLEQEHTAGPRACTILGQRATANPGLTIRFERNGVASGGAVSSFDGGQLILNAPGVYLVFWALLDPANPQTVKAELQQYTGGSWQSLGMAGERNPSMIVSLTEPAPVLSLKLHTGSLGDDQFSSWFGAVKL